DRKWARDLEFSESLAEVARELLADTRKFAPDELGFDWLMTMVERSEPQYHEFAVSYLIKAFVPAQFADTKEANDDGAPITLAGKSVRITGELDTITPADLAAKIEAAQGVLASEVSRAVTYVVVGDRESPLGGAGRKSADQVAAERLIADGVPVQLLCEADFLALLAGTRKIYSDAQVAAGCETLWSMAIAPGAQDNPQALFARRYLLAHHPQISLAKHDKPVPGGAEVPANFLTYERVKPQLSDARFAVRAFALELCRYEFARWLPGLMSLVPLAESNFPEVRDFIGTALLADEAPEHRRYRFAPEHLTGDAVYSFCESLVSTTRALGMALIEKHPR
ncbi:MAG: BRCT domain-containing protein, partial [Nannocystaceae bacterium]